MLVTSCSMLSLLVLGSKSFIVCDESDESDESVRKPFMACDGRFGSIFFGGDDELLW